MCISGVGDESNQLYFISVLLKWPYVEINMPTRLGREN